MDGCQRKVRRLEVFVDFVTLTKHSHTLVADPVTVQDQQQPEACVDLERLTKRAAAPASPMLFSNRVSSWTRASLGSRRRE